MTWGCVLKPRNSRACERTAFFARCTVRLIAKTAAKAVS